MADKPDKPDNRTEPRLSVTWYLRAGHESGQLNSCRTVNVSLSGFFFLSPLAYRVGDLVEVELFVSPTAFIKAVVQIVREEPASAGLHGYGAQFLQLSEQARQVLDAALLAVRRSQLGEAYQRAEQLAFRVPPRK